MLGPPTRQSLKLRVFSELKNFWTILDFTATPCLHFTCNLDPHGQPFRQNCEDTSRRHNIHTKIQTLTECSRIWLAAPISSNFSSCCNFLWIGRIKKKSFASDFWNFLIVTLKQQSPSTQFGTRSGRLQKKIYHVQSFRAHSNSEKCAVGWTTETSIVQISSGLPNFNRIFVTNRLSLTSKSNCMGNVLPLRSSHTILLSVMQNIFNAEIFNHKFAFVLALWTRLRKKKHFITIHAKIFFLVPSFTDVCG